MIAKQVYTYILAFLLFHICGPVAGQVNIIAANASWKYLDNGSNQGTAWREPGFNDASWASGNARLGYGRGTLATTVSFGPDANNKYPTTYFRKTFEINNLASILSLTMNIIRDDGFVVYVNGTEVGRDNMRRGTILYNHFAVTTAVGDGPVVLELNPCLFKEGSNTIAVEIHQSDGASSDILFSLELIGNQFVGQQPALSRPPYLQMGGQNAITVRWRTSVPCIGKLEVGTSVGNYETATLVSDGCISTSHEISVSGLLPATKYFYRISADGGPVFQGDANNFFTTLPLTGSRETLRFAAFGDCGRLDVGYQEDSYNYYKNYLAANNIAPPDAWLLLGDNAYVQGREADYNNNFFGVYGDILKNHKLYPTPGNHDYSSNIARQRDQNISYFSHFTMPKQAELGGIPSGTEAYYSYDVGNVHFLALDSYGFEQGDTRIYDTLGPQAVWAKADLAANQQPWTIAYFHHPPYTMGSHNSDTEEEHIKMRDRFTRILERMGVDLVLCGHSHDYERSKLINGHYGLEATYSDAKFAKSSSSGKYTNANNCPYTTRSTDSAKGTVYVVAGSAGASGLTQAGYPHNALPYSVNDGGIFYFEVTDNRLDAKFLRRNNTVWDQFTILKDVNRQDTLQATPGEPLQLTASWPGNYLWDSEETSRSVTIIPTEGDSIYTVTDGMGCIADKFLVRAGVTYVFSGNGNWTDPANWGGGKIPPDSLPKGSHIIIDPIEGGECVLNKLQMIQPGGKITVAEGKSFKVEGNLDIVQ